MDHVSSGTWKAELESYAYLNQLLSNKLFLTLSSIKYWQLAQTIRLPTGKNTMDNSSDLLKDPIKSSTLSISLLKENISYLEVKTDYWESGTMMRESAILKDKDTQDLSTKSEFPLIREELLPLEVKALFSSGTCLTASSKIKLNPNYLP